MSLSLVNWRCWLLSLGCEGDVVLAPVSGQRVGVLNSTIQHCGMRIVYLKRNIFSIFKLFFRIDFYHYHIITKKISKKPWLRTSSKELQNFEHHGHHLAEDRPAEVLDLCLASSLWSLATKFRKHSYFSNCGDLGDLQNCSSQPSMAE